jgi:D-glycero-D-manno-heptose 1,7-bisphosphate phosphatase
MPEGIRPGLGTVFIDRDGVINRKAPEHDYVKTWAEFEFLPGALEGLRLLAEEGLNVIVASNQRGVALGRVREADLREIHERMGAEVRRAGGRIDAVYYCPHAGGDCDCRKPAPGMLLAAARDFPGLRLSESALVGDRAHDMEAAAAAGSLRVLVKGFNEPVPEVDHVAEDLLDAARWLTATD